MVGWGGQIRSPGWKGWEDGSTDPVPAGLRFYWRMYGVGFDSGATKDMVKDDITLADGHHRRRESRYQVVPTVGLPLRHRVGLGLGPAQGAPADRVAQRIQGGAF